MRTLLILACCLLTLTARAETPEHALAALEGEWQKAAATYTKPYWQFSAMLGAQFGPKLIPLIFAKSHAWQGEEALAYLPYILQLPPAEAKTALQTFTASPNPTEQAWAQDYLAEIDSYQETKRSGGDYQ